MSTYTPIATQTLGTATSSVTFSSIPQGYTDLVLVISAKNSVGQNYETWLRFNEDSTSSYSQTFLQNYANSTQAGRNANITEIRPGKMNNSSFDVNIIHINNYSNATTYKTTLTTHNNAEFVTGAMVGTWRKTSAITRIDAICEAGANYTSGSTFTLYGIQAGNRLAKADGGTTVTTDGTYWYHTFRSSGAFIPNQALTNVDYLVVAGGGGGGGQDGGGQGGQGGGGAGGLRSTVNQTGGNAAGVNLESKLSLSSGISYPVIIGAGGAGATSNSNKGSSGFNSILSTITSNGGGGGGSATNSSGANGGSGGGGGWGGSGVQPGGTATANQGFNGGSQNSGTAEAGAGGGGAGSVGASITTGVNGAAGGAGVAVAISGSSVTYAGGGGGGAYISGTGGTPGAGGGAGGANATSGGSATSFTGGGGGGAGGSNNANGGNGGSGIVIIRYAV